MGSELHTLIHHLTQNEKRYFRIQASLGFEGNRKIYLQLFEAILRQKNYEEKKIKAGFETKFFAQYKQQLENKIMESLRSFHMNKSKRELVNTEISNYFLYRGKGLSKRAFAALKRAEEFSRRFELFPELLRVLNISAEFTALTAEPNEIKKHIRSIRSEIPLMQKKTELELLVKEDYLCFITLNKENEFIRRESELKSSEVLKLNLGKIIRDPALPSGAAAQLYYTLALCCFLRGEFTESFNYFQMEYEVFENHSFLKEDPDHDFLKCLSNNCLLSLTTENYESFDFFLKQLKAIHTKRNSENSKVHELRLFTLELKYLVKKQPGKELEKQVKKIHTHYKTLTENFSENNLYKTERDYLFFDLLYLEMQTENFKNAKHLLNLYFAENTPLRKTDNYILARIIFIYLLILEKDTEFAASEIRSLKRLIQKEKRNFKFEQVCLSFLSKFNASNLPAAQKSLFRQFVTECAALKKLPHESSNFFCFDLPALIVTKHSSIKKASRFHSEGL